MDNWEKLNKNNYVKKKTFTVTFTVTSKILPMQIARTQNRVYKDFEIKIEVNIMICIFKAKSY